jgi:hypothetical protein
VSFADAAKAQRGTQVAGAVAVTNKGISLIPALTLGKPAAIFDVAITNGALGFEPQFRFGLDGKPWTFIFWGRYRPLRDGKFRLTIGAHPALSFKTITVSPGGGAAPRSTIVTRRYFASDVYPSYFIAKKLSVGPYYFYGHGLDQESIQHTHFVGARAYLTNLPIANQFFLQFAPQVYYLWMDREEGTYAGVTLTLANRRLPFSIATLMNSPIHSGIPGGQAFLWNVSLAYSMR